tara:strand:- start:7334 stop:9142 length:1809 start_codon:yes stop_codon:yes gene_type:complete
MAEEVSVELNVETKKAEKNVDDLTGGIKNLTKAVEDGNEQTAAGLKSIEETSKSTGEGIKGIGSSIKAAGLGLFLIALESMKELFMQNQVVADAVGSAFEGLALVFNDVFGLLTNGQESVQKLGDAFDKYFGQPIKTATQAFEKFGDAFSKIFGGDFSGALESAQEGFSGLGDAISQTGNGLAEAATDAAEYAVDIKDASIANVKLAKEAQKAEVINAGLLEKYDRQAEQQRQIRDEERNSITDRIAANVELGRILEEQNKKMLENAKTVERAAQVAFNRNKSLENETALIAAKNEVMAVEATIEGFRSEKLANDLALDRERIELINTEKESVSNLGFEKRKFDAEQETNAIKRIEKLKEINEEEKLVEAERLQAIVNEANTGTQAKVDAQIALDEFMQTSRQESVTLEKEYTEELAAELQKRKDDELAAFVQKKEIGIATLGVLQNGLSVLKGVTEGNLKLQKAIIVADAAASIGQIIMSTQVANAKAAVAVPPTGFPFTLINTANAAIGIAATIASSKKALSAIGKGGSIASEVSPSRIGGSGSATMESQAPEFNIVGTSGANQIADVVSSQAPIKAFVVANDVTTAQALDRNIVESATL